jgi:hypothetical protein
VLKSTSDNIEGILKKFTLKCDGRTFSETEGNVLLLIIIILLLLNISSCSRIPLERL